MRWRLVSLFAATLLIAALHPFMAAAQAPSQPNDPLWGLQWAPLQVRAPQAWDQATGAGQVVAVVDSGVELDHPDLAGKIAGGATFVGCPDRDNGCGDGDVDSGERRDGDGHPHGTHVAGIVAAAADNGVGVAGVAPDARILAVKSLNGDGEGSFEEVAAGVRWATANGADVINLSLGALPGAQALTLLGDEDPLVAAIDAAIAAGVVVVAAAGNEFASICAEPAFASGALCVSATDRFESRSPFSNFPIDPDMHVVSAPGGSALLSCQDDIVSTVPEDRGDICTEIEGTPGYDFYAGSSMAAPHVAGVAALLTGLGLDNIAAVETLERTARTPVTDQRGSYTPLYGFGIVDAAAAVADATGAGPTEEPTTEPTEEPTAEPTDEPTEEPSPRPTRAPREPPRGPRGR